MHTKDNEDSNSLSIGFAPLEMRAPKMKSDQLKSNQLVCERIKLLEHRLITSIMIITPIQLQTFKFRNELKNFRFQKKSKSTSIFNEAQGSQEREVQQIFATCKDLFSNWRSNLINKFFMSFSNGDLIYFFHKPQDHDLKTNTKKGGSFVVLSCKKSSYSNIFKDYKIPFQLLYKTNLESQRLLLKNNAIQLFWKYLTSFSMQKPTNFQIISNFYFMNASQFLPLETYNGKQQRPEFKHLAMKKQNMLGQIQDQLYLLKMQGFWMKDSIQKLYYKISEIIQGLSFDIQFQCHSGSQDHQYQCEKL